MIKAVHASFYTPEPEAARAFFRDELGLPATDVGEGRLIFDLPEGEGGGHPADAPANDISFSCDDIEATVAELESKGVECATAIEDHGYGFVAVMNITGDVKARLGQPQYEKH
ncbi:MAG: VOC family protein [Planctomycetota bacterium]|jgi:catechol 2,3-dioxygenase-like lactoylglutathione lyase family enzyme